MTWYWECQNLHIYFLVYFYSTSIKKEWISKMWHGPFIIDGMILNSAIFTRDLIKTMNLTLSWLTDKEVRDLTEVKIKEPMEKMWNSILSQYFHRIRKANDRISDEINPRFKWWCYDYKIIIEYEFY